MDIDTRTAVSGAIVFLLMALVGFNLASVSEAPRQKYDRYVNFTVDSENEFVTARFDGNAVDLMRESGSRARFYIDYDRDGNGAENSGEVKGLSRDGKVHNVTELVSFDGTNYRLYFRYSDDKNVEGDGWLTLYRVKRL